MWCGVVWCGVVWCGMAKGSGGGGGGGGTLTSRCSRQHFQLPKVVACSCPP